MCSRDHFIPECFLSIKSDLFNGIYHYFLINAFNLCYLNILQTLNSYTLYRVCKRLAYADFSHYQQTSIASFDTSVTPPPPKKKKRTTRSGKTRKSKNIDRIYSQVKGKGGWVKLAFKSADAKSSHTRYNV